MKRIMQVCGLVWGLVLAGIASAFAADMAVKAPMPRVAATQIYDWTGFYLGANGGGGWNHNCWDMNGAFVVGFNPALSEGCNNASGAVVGGQVGYRQQLGNFVFGLEAQGDWADLKGSNASSVFNGINAKIAPFAINLTNTSKVDAIGMFTGQVGYTVLPAFLWYIKGGVAVTDNEYNGSLSITGPAAAIARIPNPLLTDSAKEIKFGETVGTGFEWAFAPDWSIGAEYNHLFMGNHDVGFKLTNTPFATGGGVGLLGSGSPSRNDKISSDIDMATLRLNYRFSSH